MRRAIAGVAALFVIVACGSAPVASVRSPTPQTPPAYAVMVDLLTSPTSYLANLVGRDGMIWASLKLGKRTAISSAQGHAISLPYVSTTSTALYALDGNSSILALHLSDGHQTQVTTLPVAAGSEAAFAVSPDDSRIAVSILDFSHSPVHVTLYTDKLAGGDKQVIFESDSTYVWPVAWHAGLLVLAHAVGPYVEDIAKDAPGWDNPYAAVSYHVVDPATANRVYLLGSCTVSGPLSPAGSGCIQGGTIDWSGTLSDPWSTTDWGQISSAAALSPDGTRIAAADNTNPARLGIWRPDASIAMEIDGPGVGDWAGWLDQNHVVVGSYARPTWEVKVWTLSTNKVVSAAAYGFYAARLPTDIV